MKGTGVDLRFAVGVPWHCFVNACLHDVFWATSQYGPGRHKRTASGGQSPPKPPPEPPYRPANTSSHTLPRSASAFITAVLFTSIPDRPTVQGEQLLGERCSEVRGPVDDALGECSLQGLFLHPQIHDDGLRH